MTTVLTVAALTVREAVRRRVLLAVAVLTALLLGLSGWGFQRLAAESRADVGHLPRSALSAFPRWQGQHPDRRLRRA